MERTKERLMGLLAECVEQDIEEISMQMNPIQDLEMDSILLLDFIIRIEDEYGIDFEDFAELSQHMSSVSEMLEFLVLKIEGDTTEDE